MGESVYRTLQQVLDMIPNGFPATEDGLDIKILKKIFDEDEAELVTHLKMKFETVDQIAERTGLDRELLKRKLPVMSDKGQIFGVRIGAVALYRLMPFVFGIYEFQLNRLDKDLASLIEEYMIKAFGKQFFSHTPSLMKVVPIGAEVPTNTTVEPYESVVKLIEGAKSWGVNECICKKERAIMGHRCDRPLEVCLAFAPIEHVFENGKGARPITKEEAYRILTLSEEAGLVHMTSNTATGHFYICNCCSCCCGVLMSYNFVSKNAAAKSNYVAMVDDGACSACGACVDRCQVKAIEVNEFAEIKSRCIGCGLCATACPSAAIRMVRRDQEEILSVPKNEEAWLEERARSRGIGDEYKKYL